MKSEPKDLLLKAMETLYPDHSPGVGFSYDDIDANSLRELTKYMELPFVTEKQALSKAFHLVFAESAQTPGK